MNLKKIQTDNINFTYQTTGISGFPFRWKIKVYEPKIILIDQISSREISTDKLDCIFSYNLKDIKFNFGNLWYYQDGLSDQQKIPFNSTKDLEIKVSFTQILDISSPSLLFKREISSIIINNLSLFGLYENEEFMKITLSDIMAKKLAEENNFDNWRISGQIDYSSKESLLIDDTATIAISMNYKKNKAIDADTNVSDMHYLLDLEKLLISVDTSNAEIEGQLKLSTQTPPQGIFTASISQYSAFIDKVTPEGFVFSKPKLKKMIAKAAGLDYKVQDNLDQKVNFKIIFSNEGIALSK